MSSAKVCQAPGVAAGYPVKGRKEGKPIEPPSTRPDIWAAAPCPAIRAVVRTARHTLAALFRFCPPPAASARCLHTHPVASRPASILHVRPAVSAPARAPTSVPRASAQAFDAPAGLLAPPSAAGSAQPFQRPPGLPSTRLVCPAPAWPVRSVLSGTRSRPARPSPPARTPKPDFFSQTRGSGAFIEPLPNFLRVGVGLRPTASTRARRRVQPHTRSRTSGQATPEPASHVTFSPRCSCSSAVFWSWCRLQRL